MWNIGSVYMHLCYLLDSLVCILLPPCGCCITLQHLFIILLHFHITAVIFIQFYVLLLLCHFGTAMCSSLYIIWWIKFHVLDFWQVCKEMITDFTVHVFHSSLLWVWINTPSIFSVQTVSLAVGMPSYGWSSVFGWLTSVPWSGTIADFWLPSGVTCLFWRIQFI
jgi:hypothetical protein